MRSIDADALLDELPVHPDGGMRSVKEASLMIRVRETIKNAPTVSGWVSVKDRLPEHGKRYLIYATSGDNKIGHITTAAFGGHFALFGRCAHWKVTHWMPLPEPPEVDK